MEVCRDPNWPLNHPVLSRDEGGFCICRCASLAFGTVIQSGDGLFKAVETYAVGDSVLASGTSLEWNPAYVEFSNGTTGVSRQKFTVLVLYEDAAIAVTSDHLFLTQDGGTAESAGSYRALKRADRLTPEDTLVSPDGDPVPINAVHIGDYLAGFHHIATSKEEPGPDLEGHLLNTNGVVSADYTVQLFARQDDVQGFDPTAHEEMPVIGSPEYVERYGTGSLEPPSLPTGFQAQTNIGVAGFDAPDLEYNTFIPANVTRLRVPPGAVR